jgi:hypothetical protein
VLERKRTRATTTFVEKADATDQTFLSVSITIDVLRLIVAWSDSEALENLYASTRREMASV